MRSFNNRNGEKMKIIWFILLGAICLNPSLKALSSHYSNSRIDINFNGKNKKIIYTSHLEIYDDVDCDYYRYARMPVPHNGNIDDAVITVTPSDGKKKEFGKRDAYLESNSEEYILASDDKTFDWDLGKITPGTKIDYRYEIKDNDARGGGYISILENLPVDTTIISIKFPSDKWRLKYSIDNSQSVFFDSTDQAIFAWHNMPGRDKSSYKKAPRDLMPGLWYLFESKKGEEDISDWPDVYKWAEERLGSDISLGDSAKMLEIASTPEQILAAIYKRCHYVAVELGKGWYIPESSDEVWGKGYGDCKGLAMLYVNWMKVAGYQASPVLVLSNETSFGNTEFPSPFIFDHMIASYITSSGDTAYQDITAEYCPLGYLPNHLNGCLAFPLRAGSMPFRLGPMPPQPDIMAILITGQLTSDGILVGSMDMKLKGREALLKNWLGNQTRNIDKAQRTAAFLETMIPKATILHISQDSVGQAEMDVHADLTVRRFFFEKDSLAVFRPWIFNFIAGNAEADSSRSWPTILRNNDFYKIEYRIKHDYHLGRQDTVRSISQKYVEFSYEIQDVSHDDSLILDFSLYLPPLDLSPEAYARYIDERRNMARDLDDAVIFSADQVKLK
jgi:hypothetical protein